MRAVPRTGSCARRARPGSADRYLKRDTAALTLLRPVRARHLLEPALTRRDVTTADIRSTLRDHYSCPDGICRHVNPSDESRVVSVYSVIIELDARELSIAAHPACEHPYISWRPADIFDDARAAGTPWLPEMVRPAAAVTG